MDVTENKILSPMIKGVLISILTTVALLIIFAGILTFTNVPESSITPVIILVTAISILIGSSITNHKIRKKGLLNGAAIGGIYMIIIYLISSILNGYFMLNSLSVIMIVLGIIAGILGGIMGVNIK